MNNNDKNTLKGRKLKTYPTFDEIRLTLFQRTPLTEMEMRDRAMIALLASTGVRDGALIGIKLKHIKITTKSLEQIPPEVKTKFGKIIYTRFFPVGDDIHQVVFDWIDYLRVEKGFDDACPVFPKEDLSIKASFHLQRGQLSRHHWADAGRVRDIVKEQFAAVGLPAFVPHRFRDSLGALRRVKCRSPEEHLAWSRNLGHESLQTTLLYAPMDPAEQFEIMEKLEESDTVGKAEIEKALAVLRKATEERR